MHRLWVLIRSAVVIVMDLLCAHQQNQHRLLPINPLVYLHPLLRLSLQKVLHQGRLVNQLDNQPHSHRRNPQDNQVVNQVIDLVVNHHPNQVVNQAVNHHRGHLVDQVVNHHRGHHRNQVMNQVVNQLINLQHDHHPNQAVNPPHSQVAVLVLSLVPR